MNNEPTLAKVQLTDGLGPANEMQPLVDRLRTASAGYDEWRVQDPKDGSYCIAFDRRDSLNPEREARHWLLDHQKRFPGGLHADFVVACVRVLTADDELMIESVTEIERLRAALDQKRAEYDDPLRATHDMTRNHKIQLDSAVAAERGRAARVCEDEARIRIEAGNTHPEDSDSRSRCFAAARAAINCAKGVRGGEVVGPNV